MALDKTNSSPKSSTSNVEARLQKIESELSALREEVNSNRGGKCDDGVEERLDDLIKRLGKKMKF